MKRRLLTIVLLLLCCVNALAQTVGAEISAEDIAEFFYTYDWVGYNAFYQRYHFYVEDGKRLFFHETRGTEDGYGWNTEDDVVSIGTRALSEEEWAAFLDCLKGGDVTGESEEPLDGDSGPWMYLRRNGDESALQAFRFRSSGDQSAFVELCGRLAAEPGSKADPVS